MPLFNPRMGCLNDTNIKCHKRLDLPSLDTILDEIVNPSLTYKSFFVLVRMLHTVEKFIDKFNANWYRPVFLIHSVGYIYCRRHRMHLF